jgi:D-alanyl-lipoteichoic acid acyltransferase DltB (MBOAT superfamily)
VSVPSAPSADHQANAGRARAEAVDLWKLASLVMSLLFLTGLISHFGVESKAFLYLTLLSVAGFAIHYFLPLPYRLPFFLALSLGAIGFLLGPVPAAWLVGLGLLLIGICHVPVPFGLRVSGLVAVGAVLLIWRGGWASGPVPAVVWPILGSMFMFRLISYLYDLKHDPGLASIPRSLSYFFLLPNVCFPLFPVVDFKTFCLHYYNDDRHRIYMVGVQWIFRGVVQLILYRLVYQALVLEPASVETIADLGQYLLWPYLLYLRVSGMFHIVVGLLHLFGFNLPETHHSYFLASSFTDFWRRINIYWKDFMMKVFYYPAYFALRKRGEIEALVLSTLVVFAVTWALHSYQTFWIQGTFLLAWNDALFWTLLAVLVVANALHEWRRGRQRRLANRVLPWPDTLRSAAATVGMFCTICVLWSLWSTESLATWISLWSAAATLPAPGQGWTVALLVAVPVTIALCVLATSRAWLTSVMPVTYHAQAALVAGVATCLVLASTSRVYKHLGPAGTVIAAVRFGGLNQADMVGLERGYYENLMGVDRFNGELWALYMNRPPDWERGLADGGLSRDTGEFGGFPPYELRPSTEGRFKGVPLRTNRFGLHDKEYTQTPPPGCYRLALLGASHAMGSGVLRENTFEAVVEDRLNRERHTDEPACFEILNFSVYGYTPLYQINVLNEKVASFQPNTMLYVAHPGDSGRIIRFVVQSIRAGKRLPFDDLSAIVQQAAVDAQMSERVATQRLAPLADQIMSWLYRRLVDDCRRRNIAAAYVFLPMVVDMEYSRDTAQQIGLAREAGFVVLDLTDVYVGSDRNSLWVAEWDAHPNADGHRLIADRLYGLIRQHRGQLLNAISNARVSLAR